MQFQIQSKTGAPAEWFKVGHQFLAKNAIMGGTFQFFSLQLFDMPRDPGLGTFGSSNI